ncbi:MAG: type II secretion system protein [bacterium]
MKNQKALHKGFTLIELLVVVAIIGILAAVVLAALGSARNRGGDAAVQSNLNTVRNQAEIFNSNNGYSYLPKSGSIFSVGPCPAYNANGTNMISRDKQINAAIVEAVKRGGNGSSCYNSATAWAVAVGLKTKASNSWCVDAAGKSKLENFAPNAAINAATGACK